MPPKESFLDPSEAFQNCVEKLSEDGIFCTADIELGRGVHAHLSRRLSHLDAGNPERVTSISTSLNISNPSRGDFLIRVTVNNPRHMEVQDGSEGVPEAVTILASEYNHQAMVGYTVKGVPCTVSPNILFPDVDMDGDSVSTVIVESRAHWKFSVPAYDKVLENIADGGLGVALREVHGLENDMAMRVVEFALSPDWKSIELDLPRIVEA